MLKTVPVLPTSGVNRMPPAAGSTSDQITLSPHKFTDQVPIDFAKLGGRMTPLSNRSCTSWRRRKQSSVVWPVC
ncbi:hypothetical protein HYC85_030714 [Camellia sinensis]|uniref:Uncharacterized protein n=1 Tax=Camellia sinensis TaxID=4442 RepID=A0A7J7G1G7_CAMSI|nr:hypothetical protein HYC85_030714 [Camellia sinensis]